MTEVEELFAAIAAGDRDRVRALLDPNPALLAERGPAGATAALAALYAGHGDLADELAARSSPLDVFSAAAFEDTERLAELIDADRTVIEQWSPDGWQPLHLAAFFGRPAAARMLLDADAPVGEASHNEMAVQPLHAAAAGSHSELVWLLIASDADVAARQRQGWTPPHSAVANDDSESVRALLSAGADPDQDNDEGTSARALARSDEVRKLLDGI